MYYLVTEVVNTEQTEHVECYGVEAIGPFKTSEQAERVAATMPILNDLMPAAIHYRVVGTCQDWQGECATPLYQLLEPYLSIQNLDGIQHTLMRERITRARWLEFYYQGLGVAA